MKETKALLKEIHNYVLNDKILVDKVTRFIRAHPEMWIHNDTHDTMLTWFELAINFKVPSREDIATANPWFQVNIGTIAAQQAGLSFFPSNNLIQESYWINSERVQFKRTELPEQGKQLELFTEGVAND